MVVAVVGLGLIGGSLAISLKQRGFASKIIGVDNNPDHCSEALSLKIVDEVCDLNKASKLHAGQAKTLKGMVNGKTKRPKGRNE